MYAEPNFSVQHGLKVASQPMENARMRDMEVQRCRPDVVAIRHW